MTTIKINPYTFWTKYADKPGMLLGEGKFPNGHKEIDGRVILGKIENTYYLSDLSVEKDQLVYEL